MAGALAGLNIIEVGTMVSAPYAAKLMADMGAEVIKLEPPAAGDPARTRGPFPGGQPHPDKSGLFLYLNANKFGVTLDIAQAEGLHLLAALAERADVLIHNMAPPEMDRTGLSFERLNQRNPRLVMTSIAPFGLTGAHRNWRAEELTVWSSGGVCVLNGAGPNHPELPPLKTFGSQSGFQAGVHAAVATMGAVFGRRRGATGQHVEVSAQESLVSQNQLVFEYWPYMEVIATRLGRKPLQPMEAMECKDGWIYVCCVEEHQWRNFVALMGDPDWANEEIFSDRLKRAENWEALEIFLREWVGEQTVLDLYRKAQDKRVPFAPVSTMGDLLNSEHLKSRGFFVELTHPVAGTYKYPRGRRSSLAPRRGRSGCPHRRWASITGKFPARGWGSTPSVCELAPGQRSYLNGARAAFRYTGSPTSPGYGPGLIAPCNWRTFGADVIRMESATRPCITRMLPPWPGSKQAGINSSGYYKSVQPAATFPPGAQFQQARSAGDRAAPGRGKRRGGQQLRARRDGSARIGLRTAQGDQTRHHHDLTVRLRR